MAPNDNTSRVNGIPPIDPPITSGFSKYPSQRDQVLAKNGQVWMEGFRKDGNVWPYWRIHDKLYDLTEFVDKHPGGKFWLEITKGTDITELFESAHIGSDPELISNKYFVSKILTPRTSPFTFEENGFYKTLKRKVAPLMKTIKNGPSYEMILIQDGLFFSFLSLFIFAAYYQSYISMMISGFILALATVSSHNFFHQKDNWRMYIFDFSLLSSTDWRITHAISHHMFPNTIYDFEISIFEPFVELLPKKNKTWWGRYSILATCNILFITMFFADLVKRTSLCLMGKDQFRWTDLIRLVQYLCLVAFTNSATEALWFWLTLHASCNLLFLHIGLTGAHHHQETFIEGDKSIKDKDWGLHQIAATSNRGRAMTSLFLTAVSFGNHTLHHLFPTTDHSKLPLLLDPFLETCKEFGVEFQMFSWAETFKGFFYRVANNTTNENIPDRFKNLSNR